MMNDSLFCTIYMDLKKHRMPLLETVIITDRDRQILGMKVLIRMLNRNTLFNANSHLSDVLIVNYAFDDIELFTFKSLDDSLIISHDQKYIEKWSKIINNVRVPVQILQELYLGIITAFFDENEIKIEYVSPVIVAGDKLDQYIEKFRHQTMYRKN